MKKLCCSHASTSVCYQHVSQYWHAAAARRARPNPLIHMIPWSCQALTTPEETLGLPGPGKALPHPTGPDEALTGLMRPGESLPDPSAGARGNLNATLCVHI